MPRKLSPETAALELASLITSGTFATADAAIAARPELSPGKDFLHKAICTPAATPPPASKPPKQEESKPRRGFRGRLPTAPSDDYTTRGRGSGSLRMGIR